MGRHLRLFLLIQFLFSISSSLSGLFVNVFLWKVNQNLLDIAFFNMTMSASIMVMMFPAGWLGRRFNTIWCLRAAMLLYSVFYLLIYLFQERTNEHVVLLGILQGTAIAFYALAMHVIGYDHSTNENRSRYFGWSSMVTTLGAMVAPLASGWVIVNSKALEGYQSIFFISLSLFAVAGIVSLFLPGRGQQRRSSLLQVMKQGGRDWWNVQLANGVYGLHDGVMWFLLQLVSYWILNNEFEMGLYNTAASVLSLFAAMYVGKQVRPHTRVPFFLLGAIGVGIGHLILATNMTVAGLVLYTLLVTIFTHFYSIPYYSITFDVISRDPLSEERRIDYIVSREVPLGIGRLISVGAFISMYEWFDNQLAVQIVIGVLGILYLSCWWLMAQISTKKARSVER